MVLVTEWTGTTRVSRKVHHARPEVVAVVAQIVGGFRWMVRVGDAMVDRGHADHQSVAKREAWQAAQRIAAQRGGGQ